MIGKQSRDESHNRVTFPIYGIRKDCGAMVQSIHQSINKKRIFAPFPARRASEDRRTKNCKMKQVGYFKSPVGVYEIRADNDGVTYIQLKGTKAIAEEETDKKLDLKSRSTQHIKDCIAWLDAYFSNSSLAKVKLPALNVQEYEQSKPFCCKVWKILKDRVKAGETVTYGDLANMAGNPKGARAVGMAMKTNPISIIVPCHRVLKGNGDLGNYSSYNGTATKKWLLQHENAIN